MTPMLLGFTGRCALAGVVSLLIAAAQAQDAPAAPTTAADTTAAAEPPSFCTNIGLNFFPVVGGTDYGALNSPSGWTPEVQRDIGNTWNGTLDTIVIYNGPGTAVKIHVSAQHFLTINRAWVADGCLYNIPAPPPRAPAVATVPSVAARHLLQGRFYSSATPAAAPTPTAVAPSSDAGTMTEADAAAAFAAGAADRAAAREAAAVAREAARQAAALAASAPPVSVAAANAVRPAGQVVTRPVPVEFSYSINGSTPVVVPSLTMAGRQEPVAAITPDLSNMKDVSAAFDLAGWHRRTRHGSSTGSGLRWRLHGAPLQWEAKSM